jgi:DNA polymerase-3 subunit gamma/tau
LYVSPAEQGTVRNAAGHLGLETVLAILGILDQTISRLKYAAYPRIAAELAIVRICKLEDLESLPQVIAQLRDGLPKTAPVGAASTSAAVSKKKFDEPSVTSGSESELLTSPAWTNGNGHQATAPVFKRAETAADSAATHSSNGNGSRPPIPLPASNQALAIWKQAATQLGGLAAEKAMQASEAAIVAPNQLVVTFARKYNFCKQFCERPEISSQIAEIVARLAGQPLSLQFCLADEAPQEQAAARPATLRQRMNEVCQRPLVRQAIELFNATPMRLEEPERISQ